jgi:hypothetical protein
LENEPSLLIVDSLFDGCDAFDSSLLLVAAGGLESRDSFDLGSRTLDSSRGSLALGSLTTVSSRGSLVLDSFVDGSSLLLL